MTIPPPRIVALVGPTASGKSSLALEIAERIGAEIVSVDSMQVYRGMDIGTAKPDAEMRRRIPHHLVDIANPPDEVTAAAFRYAGHEVLDDLAARGVPALITGGSGLHFRALVDPMSMAPTDPEVRQRIESAEPNQRIEELLRRDPTAGSVVDLANPRRVIRALEVLELTDETPTQRRGSDEYQALRRYEPERPFVGIGVDPASGLRERVTERFDEMLTAGLVDEVRGLAPRLGRTAGHAVGYRQLLPVLTGDIDLAEAREASIRATMRLAKRQRTFFRRDPRLRWISWDDDATQRMDAIMRVVSEETPWTS